MSVVAWELARSAVRAMLDASVPAEEAIRAAGPGAPTWLAAGLAAARAPSFWMWTEGEAPVATVYGGEICLLVVEPGTVVGLASEEVPLALWGVLGLGPRPAPSSGGGTVRLAPGPMAALIANRRAHGHGLPPATAAALQRRLVAGVRHRSVRLAQPRPDGRERRRNLEILDGEGGIWRIHQHGDELVELAPTTTTAVLRDLVSLVNLAAGAIENELNAMRPAGTDQPRRPSTHRE